MRLLQQKLPASQYENDIVHENSDEENYEDDFEKADPDKQTKNNSNIQEETKITENQHKTDRKRNKIKGLPPTAPSQRVLPQMPQSNRNKEHKGININPPQYMARNVQSRKSSRGQQRSEEESFRK